MIFFTRINSWFKNTKPNMNGEYQLENASAAIATLRVLSNLNIKDSHIMKGVKKAYNMARLEEIKSGKLKDLIPNNTLIIDCLTTLVS